MKKNFVLFIFLLPLHSLHPMEEKAVHPGEQDEIMKAISESSSLYFKPLLELKATPDIIGTENEQLIKRTLVQCMGGIFPDSLKECCAKKILSLGSFESSRLPQHLLVYLNDVRLSRSAKLGYTLYPLLSNTLILGLYRQLIEEDRKKVCHLFYWIDKEDKFHFLKEAVRITGNWDIVYDLIDQLVGTLSVPEHLPSVVLKKKININTAPKQKSSYFFNVRNYLFIQAVNAGNLLLTKKFLLHQNFDFDVYEFKFDLAPHISEAKDPAILFLLRAAGISERQMTPSGTILSWCLDRSNRGYFNTHRCINYLKMLQEKGWTFSMEEKNYNRYTPFSRGCIKYTPLEQALLTGQSDEFLSENVFLNTSSAEDAPLALLNFISFIISEASQQHIALENLITNLKKVSPYKWFGISWDNQFDFELWKLARHCIMVHKNRHTYVMEKAQSLKDTKASHAYETQRKELEEYEKNIECIKRLLPFCSPSVKTHKDATKKTLLDYLNENQRLAQDAELVALLTP